MWQLSFRPNFISEKMDTYWESKRPKNYYIWKSTGFYAKAGTMVNIEIPTELINIIKVIFKWLLIVYYFIIL